MGGFYETCSQARRKHSVVVFCVETYKYSRGSNMNPLKPRISDISLQSCVSHAVPDNRQSPAENANPGSVVSSRRCLASRYSASRTPHGKL